MKDIECTHIYGFAGFVDEHWLIYSKEDLALNEEDMIEIFKFCPLCGVELGKD